MSIRLFDFEYLPLTHSAGFLQTRMETAYGAFEQWMNRLDRSWTRKTLVGSIHVGLDKLLPMTWPSTQLLFWTTKSKWTLALDNSGGGFISTVVPYLSHEVLSCQGLRVVWAPHIGFKNKRGAHGGTILDVYAPAGLHGLVRSISRIHESGWTFETFGEHLTFEQYTDAELKKHWSKGLLVEYARALGVELDDPNFFGTAGVIYEEKADWVKNCRVQTLDEARHEMRLDEVSPDKLR